MDDAILSAWKPVAGALFNAAYEAGGPGKHEIEEMRTDAEYEARVVACVLSAWGDWGREGKPELGSLVEGERVAVVAAALESPEARYGWYRGDLPSKGRIRRALRAVG